MKQSPRVGLRARGTVAFAVGAFGVSIALVGLTYLLTRTYLVRQRESLAVRQTYLDARVVRDVLLADSGDIGKMVDSLAGQAGSDILVNVNDKWFSSSLLIGESFLPSQLVGAVNDGHVGQQRIDFDSVPTLVVGVPLPAANASYYEVFPMRELDKTLRTLLVVLSVAATITTIGGAGVGFLASRRVLRPLRDVSAASAEIAAGALATRLDSRNDPDLDLLVTSFNNMAQSLERRIEREARFASDVSHELRTPLTAMTNATQVVRTRSQEMPPRMQTALAVFVSQVAYFEQLVLDLLEISRLDAGVEKLDPMPVDVEQLIRSAAARAEVQFPTNIDASVPDEVVLDERRIIQALVNLFDNATRYAGGVTGVVVETTNGRLLIHVDDSGPGVSPDERTSVFERFHRGSAASPSGARKGTGLGLALAREHVHLHAGSLFVTDSATGGARFTIDLPLARP